MSSLAILKLVESGLSRARSIADHAAEDADDGFLLYLIDMAIFEAKSKARSRSNAGEGSAAGIRYCERNNGG